LVYQSHAEPKEKMPLAAMFFKSLLAVICSCVSGLTFRGRGYLAKPPHEVSGFKSSQPFLGQSALFARLSFDQPLF